MKQILTYSILVLVFYSCDKNEVHDNEHATPQAYKQVSVEFFLEHPSYEIEEAVFDTVSEVALLKEQYREGAIFETVTEQVLTKEGYSQMQIATGQLLSIVVDAQNDRIGDFPCRKFYMEDELITEEIDPTYATRSYQKVLVDGSGPEMPAEYKTITALLLMKDAKLVPRLSETSATELVDFVIPVNKTFKNYLKEQLSIYNTDCGTEDTYRIVP